MKRLLLVVLVLGLATWLGVKIHADPGYVLIAYKHWSVETTLWFALLVLAVVLLLAYFVVRIGRALFHIGPRIKYWRQQHLKRRARRWTNRGLRLLAEGQWRTAEKYLIRRAQDSEVPFVNYLAAARAAQAQHQYQRRDDYLREAELSKSVSTLAVALSQAQLQMEAHQYEQATATLYHLHQKNPNHLYILKLLKDAYIALEDWGDLYDLLPLLERKNVLDHETFRQLEFQTYQNLMALYFEQQAYDEVVELWRALPKRLAHNQVLATWYVDALHCQGHDIEAVRCINDIVKRQWAPELIQRYGYMLGADLKKQLDQAENWLKIYGNRPLLLLTLGQLAKEYQAWDKAQNYLQLALQLEPTGMIYYEMAELMEHLGKSEQACDYYKKGLVFMYQGYHQRTYQVEWSRH